MSKRTDDTRFCQCGCGLPVTRKGRAVYYTDVHKQRDFRVRQKAHKWAYYAMNQYHFGDMTWYPQLFEEYYLAEQTRQVHRHAAEIKEIRDMYYSIPDEELPF
jgi:hypothetical protein